MNGDIFVNAFQLPDTDGSLILTPGTIDFEKSERTIDNTLVSDFVGFKKTFRIAWKNQVSGALLKVLEDIYLLKEDVTLTIIDELAVTNVYTCRMNMSTEYTRESTGSVFSYSGVAISFDEV